MIPTQNAPIIFVVGPAGHGKTTVRRLICEKTGLKGDSTSNVLFGILELITATPENEFRDKPKEEVRPLLVQLGDVVTGHSKEIPAELLEVVPVEIRPKAISVLRSLADPATLSRLIFLDGGSVIDGIRRPEEFRHAITHLAWAGYSIISIWVENPSKAKVPADNFRLTKDQVKPHFFLENDGTLDDLEMNVEKILEKLGWAPKVSADEPIILNSKGTPALVDETPDIKV
jgi:hypothetical protein